MPGLVRRQSRKCKSNNKGDHDPDSTSSIDGSVTITSMTDYSNMIQQGKQLHPFPRSRTSMKHLTLKRLKSNPTKTTPRTTTTTTTRTTRTSLSSSPLDTTQLEIIMHNDASEDFNDLKSLLTENDSTNYNNDNNNNNNNNSNNNNHNNPSTTPSKKEDESKIKRMTTRLISGWLMVGTFVGTMYLGHIYMCTLIFLVEVALVRFSLLYTFSLLSFILSFNRTVS